MAERRPYQQRRVNYNYIDGNTARQLNAAPQRRERERQNPAAEPRRYPQKMPASMPGINGAGFLFLTCVLATIVLCAFSYLHTQSTVREMKRDIISMQSEIAETKETNDAKYQEILATVDLSEVYERATEELQMVQAENNQIYTYKNKKSDMVKQYADIPGAAE